MHSLVYGHTYSPLGFSNGSSCPILHGAGSLCIKSPTPVLSTHNIAVQSSLLAHSIESTIPMSSTHKHCSADCPISISELGMGRGRGLWCGEGVGGV